MPGGVDVVYDASLDPVDVLKQLEKIQKNIAKTAGIGDEHFKDIGNSAKVSGVQIGAVSGVVQELTSRFIEAGIEAVATFKDITEEGVELNKNLETAGRVFGAAFGDPKLGQATLDFLKDVSDQLNVDRDQATAFAQSILPKTGSLEEFTQLLKLTDIQADATSQTIGDLEFSIREALSGDFVSLKDRFDLGKDQIQQIKDLTPELGRAQAIIKVVGDDFERLGKVNIQGTLATDIKSVQAQASNLQRVFAEPAFEELKELFEELGDILNERGDDFELIAKSFGNVVANVIDFIGSGITDFLENLDTEEAVELAENLFDMVDNARTLVEVLGLLELPGDLLPSVNKVVEGLERATRTAIQLTALAKAEAARLAAEQQVTAEATGSGVGLAFSRAALTGEDRARAEAAGQEAFNRVLGESLALLDQSTKRQEENKEAIEAHREALEADTSAQDEANRAAIDAQLRQKVLQDTIKAGQAAQETIDAEIEDQEQEHQEKLFDIQKKVTDQRLEDEIKASEKREDIARKAGQRVEDIERKNSQAIADAGKDLRRNEQDIARKHARELADLDKDRSKERITIEQDFQNEIQAIRTRFNQAAEDAERNRDALAFIEAQRQADREVEQAKQTRDEKVTTAKDESAQRREELRIAQEREIEDAKITNQRKLEDLRVNLERELEAQRINQEREEEELQISLERQEAARQRALEKELENASITQQRKLEALEQSLAAEYQAVQAAEQAKTELIKVEAEKQKALLEQVREEARFEDTGLRRSSRRGGSRGRRPPNFDGGGVIPGSPGQPVPIIGHGQELVLNRSQQSALFNALNRQPSPVPLPPNISNVSSSVDRSLNVDTLNFGSQMSLMERIIALEQALEILARIRSN